MPATRSSLMLQFRTRDTRFGVTRATVKALAARFDLSETEVIHMALSRLVNEELLAYMPDGGPLMVRDLRDLGRRADATLPKGRILKKRSLF